jgi:hypothetical protein
MPEQTPTPSPATQALLDAMPGMTGAIEAAFRDNTGETVPFVLVAFVGGVAVHATNIQPASNAMVALKNLTDAWSEGA